MITLASESVVEFAFMPSGRLHETVRLRQHTGIIIITQLSSAYIMSNTLWVNFYLCKLLIAGSRVSTAEAYMQCKRMFSVAIFSPCLDPRKEVLKHPVRVSMDLVSFGLQGIHTLRSLGFLHWQSIFQGTFLIWLMVLQMHGKKPVYCTKSRAPFRLLSNAS